MNYTIFLFPNESCWALIGFSFLVRSNFSLFLTLSQSSGHSLRKSLWYLFYIRNEHQRWVGFTGVTPPTLKLISFREKTSRKIISEENLRKEEWFSHTKIEKNNPLIIYLRGFYIVYQVPTCRPSMPTLYFFEGCQGETLYGASISSDIFLLDYMTRRPKYYMWIITQTACVHSGRPIFPQCLGRVLVFEKTHSATWTACVHSRRPIVSQFLGRIIELEKIHSAWEE